MKQVNNNKTKVNNNKIGFDVSQYKQIVSQTKSRTNNLTSEMLACKIDLEKVLDNHYKSYEVTEFNHEEKTMEVKVVKGFLDKHPRKEGEYCIRVFNIFAPLDEPKIKASSHLEFIKQVS